MFFSGIVYHWSWTFLVAILFGMTMAYICYSSVYNKNEGRVYADDDENVALRAAWQIGVFVSSGVIMTISMVRLIIIWQEQTLAGLFFNILCLVASSACFVLALWLYWHDTTQELNSLNDNGFDYDD